LLGTTLADFVQPGTQPSTLTTEIRPSANCGACHFDYEPALEPGVNWAASMMAQSTRDPIFHAALAIAEQDAGNSGDYCLRCHAPGAWLAGRSVPTDGSGLVAALGDLDGVTCNLCHRMVDPVFEAENPPEDALILASLGLPPTGAPHSGQFVIDPEDWRRGPFDLGPTFGWHDWLESPFHREALLCGTCHDVSNPVFERQADGSYAVGALSTPHPTHDKRDEFPVERTFSEWANSVFARAEMEMGGRFGGNKSAVATCQDCHLPDVTGVACAPGLGGRLRDDMPLHSFTGVNSWVLRAIRRLYPDSETRLSAATVDAALARSLALQQSAADLHAFERGGELVVRTVNQTGHKLPTGYGEGRRMWLNVRFLDAAGHVVAEHGAYDAATAELSAADTRVYEVVHAIGSEVAAATGLPAGPSFHFTLNNETALDNRIPPRGFTNEAFAAAQAEPVAYAYEQEQYWDDVAFAIPGGAARVEVRLFHQTTTKEYVEFLRDQNRTNDAGRIAYRAWLLGGKSAPVEMALVELDRASGACPPPLPYGLGLTSSLGERPRLGWAGTPSLAAGNFEVTVSGAVPGQLAGLFWSERPKSVPFYGGTLLIDAPVRGPIFTLDAGGGASVPVAVTPAMVGTERFYQVFFRDPAAAEHLGLSDGLHVDFCN